jgi:hypothetical protein
MGWLALCSYLLLAEHVSCAFLHTALKVPMAFQFLLMRLSAAAGPVPTNRELAESIQALLPSTMRDEPDSPDALDGSRSPAPHGPAAQAHGTDDKPVAEVRCMPCARAHQSSRLSMMQTRI